ncbi:MAG: putative transketolase [Xanthobacteraceae bacterium]|nr:MAG: putative transketolase [Xanthobacteraceae bacterium]
MTDRATADRLAMLAALEKKILWLASWTIHNANHVRDNRDGLKVGGHQASSASLATIMTALYFAVLRPEDRVAVKPHASPNFHAIQYLLGHQTRENLENFRGYKGAQSYPSRTKDIDDVDFSTGSVGLGVAQTLFSSLAQDYVRAHGWGLDRPEGRMVALIGDAEMDEGNIYEALIEGWKHGLRNTWWVVDYNRQSLDAVVREGLWERFEAMFRNFGWDVVILKYGKLLEAFESIDHDRPVCFIAYTIKGFGLPFQGHKDNHAGLMTPAQMEAFRAGMGVRPGFEWETFEGLDVAAKDIAAFLKSVPFAARGRRRYQADKLPVPATLAVPMQPAMATQQGFGLILNEIARGSEPFADRIVTTSPDVTVSTNLGAFVNRRGLFAREALADTFRQERIPSTFTWDFSPKGQHVELGIAEMNLFIMLSALGLSHAIHGERLLPVGTLYDPFIQRGLDALNYACYQDARFMLVATPSGVTLAPEGGAHQSIGTPLIGMAQDGLAAFEPAFVDELATIMRFGFDYMQRDGEGDPDEETWLRDETGGSVYLRLSTRSIDQPQRTMDPGLAADIINGGYWMRRPGPNAGVVIAYMGAVAPEAIAAAGLLAETHRDVGVLAITSADRLNAGWTAAERARQRGHGGATSHVERLLAPLSRDCGLVSVVDGHPATLAWLGAVHGHRVRSLGVEHFGQTGTVDDLYRHHGIWHRHQCHPARGAGGDRRPARALPVGSRLKRAGTGREG